MTDDILDKEEEERIEEEKEMNFLDQLLKESHEDWKMRLLAITKLIEHLLENKPKLIEEVEKSDESQLSDIVKKWATKTEFDNFMHYEHKNSSENGGCDHAIIYANVMNYALPLCNGLDPSSDNVTKMEAIGYSILLTKALNCMKTAMEQLPDEVLD